MSEHITHVAVYGDTVRLIQYSDRFTEAFKESTANEFDSGFVASGTNGNQLWAVPLLEEYRNKYKTGDRSRETLKKIAAAIGWITHRAADLVVKPILANVGFEKNPVFTKHEQTVYYDCVAFREVFKGGKSSGTVYEPIDPSVLDDDMKTHPASGMVNIGELETPVSHFYLNEFLKNHEFVEEQQDFESWFELFMKSKQKFSKDLNDWIDSYQRPDPTKTEKYITNFKYYNSNDQIIRLVRSIQSGNPNRSIHVDVALAASNCQSQYAKIISTSYTMLSYASDFFDGKIEKATLCDVLNLNGSEPINEND